MSAISTHFEMLLPADEQERIGATPDKPEEKRVLRVLDHYVETHNENVKFRLLLNRLRNEPALWRAPRAGGQDQYAGMPPAMRLIDAALKP